MLLCIKVIIECCTNTSYMKGDLLARCKAYTYFSVIYILSMIYYCFEIIYTFA
jgi:hypothetical protein